jgi:DNA-binding response OmpR family regulator
MKKILIIDDFPQNVEIIKDCLEVENFVLLTTSDTREAVNIAKSELPDLIILDVMMPNYNGFELCKMFAEDKITSEIPVIILSALNNAESIKKGLEAGAIDFVSKPFDCVELSARVKSSLKIAENKKLSIELEKNNFAVKAYRLANHKLKQPLTVLKLANTALKKELSKDALDIEQLNKKIDYIDTAVNNINGILNDLERIFKEDSTENLL